MARQLHSLAPNGAIVGGGSDPADGWPARSLSVVARNRRRGRLPQDRLPPGFGAQPALVPKRAGESRAPTDKFAPRTLVSPVAHPYRSQRHHNSNPPNDFRLLSPKTRSATECPTRHNSPRRSPRRCRQNRLRPRRPTKTRWPSRPPWPPWPTRQNQSFFYSPRTTTDSYSPQLHRQFCRPSQIFVARRFAPNSRNSNNLHIVSPTTRVATELTASLQNSTRPHAFRTPSLTPRMARFLHTSAESR
jgi:hypothetical protein